MAAVQAMTGQRRLADDGLPDARRRAVLRRHLFPARPTSRSCVTAVRDAWPTSVRQTRRDVTNGSRQSGRDAAACRPWRSPAGGLDLDAKCSPPRSHGLRVERSTARAAASAARRSSRRPMDLEFLLALRRADRRCPRRSMVDGDARRDGPRRHLRPARRRLPPLLDRRALAGPALREDALRQRAARRGLHAPVAADGQQRLRRGRARPPGSGRDLRLHAQGTPHPRGRPGRVARRRQRRRRDVLRLDPGPAARGARRRRR